MRLSLPLMLVVAAACGHDTDGPGDTVQLEAAQAVTVRVGPAGGRIQTTDSHGRTYLLDIPAHALRDSVDITLTPVASYELPSGVSLAAAAQFAPEGLQLAIPARLAIVASGMTGGAVAGFGYSGDGDSLHLELMGRRGDTLFVPVHHFSGAGAAASVDVSTLTAALPSGGAVQAYIDVEQLSYQGAAAESYDVAALTDAMRHWATDVIIPALQAASTDQQLLNAEARYADWVELMNCGSGGGNASCAVPVYLWPEAVRTAIALALVPTYDQLRIALATALKSGIDRATATCVAQHDLQAAANSVWWELLAARQGVTEVVGGLDVATFNAHFCVSVILEAVTMPATLTGGTTAQLQVQAGVSFGGGAPDHSAPLLVTVSVSNATPASVSGSTSNGTYTTPLVPTGESPLFLGIRAALTQHGLDIVQHIYRDTTYEQPYGHIAITPTAAILDAGAEAQFTAVVTGLASSAVTWTATGGTLSGTSTTGTTYTAGGTPGTYAITATSVADPTQRATARVDIVSGVTVVVSPASVSLAPGGVQQFTATVTGTADHSVSWSALGGTSVVAGNTLTYTAGNNPGTYTVSATSVADPSAGGAAQVSIGFEAGDIYAGTLTYQPWPNPVPGQEPGVTKPFAFILSAVQNTWVWCNASGESATQYSPICALAGAPFGATMSAAFGNVTLDGIGRLSTTPTGNCYFSGQLQDATITSGTVHGTGATGALYCPVNGNYQVYFTFTTLRR